MVGETLVTVVGNVVADPELKFTPSGVACTSVTVASTPRKMNSETNQWEDGEPLFLRCTLWRHLAENFAETVRRGDQVIVCGRLRQRRWETETGERRTSTELDAEVAGPSLRYATAKVTRRAGGRGGNVPAEAPGRAQPTAAPDPWFPEKGEEPPF